MATTHLGIRIDEDLKRDYERLAQAEGRSLSNQVERVLDEWMRTHKARLAGVERRRQQEGGDGK